MAEAAAKPGIFARVTKFFKDLRGEAKKIVWPTYKQVLNNTAIVIACVLVVGAFIWILDALLSLIVGVIL